MLCAVLLPTAASSVASFRRNKSCSSGPGLHGWVVVVLSKAHTHYNISFCLYSVQNRIVSLYSCTAGVAAERILDKGPPQGAPREKEMFAIDGLGFTRAKNLTCLFRLVLYIESKLREWFPLRIKDNVFAAVFQCTETDRLGSLLERRT